MKLKLFHLILLTLIGALMLGLGFPFTGGVTPFMFIGLVPLLIVQEQIFLSDKYKWLKRFVFTYFFFVLYNFITTFWIYYASEGGMYMAVLSNSFLMTLPFLFGGLFRKSLGHGKALLGILLGWLSFEYAHYSWELSWPWLNFGNSLGTSPILIQWYEYSGVLGGSFWIWVVNISIYYLVTNVWLKKESFKIQTPIVLFTLLSIILPIISSITIIYTYEEKEDPVEMVVVQPNFDPYTEKFSIPLQLQLGRMFTLSEQKSTPTTEVIVWPETALPAYFFEDIMEDELLIKVVREFLDSNYSTSLITGADTYGLFQDRNSEASFDWYGRGYRENYNSALLIENNNPLQVYHKSKLVLGAEKLPFLSWLPFLKEFAIEMGGTLGMLGIADEPENITTKGVSFATLICYESVYGEYTSQFVRKGAEIICVITNDGWWEDTPGYKQHRSFSQIRAIENRRSVARSANTGISCFINQRGEIIEELDWDVAGAMNQRINRNTEITFYTKYGDLIGRIAVFLFLTLILYAIVQLVKKKGVTIGRE